MLQIFSSIIRWAARSFTILIVAVFLAFAAGEPAGSFGRNSLSRLGGYAAFVRSYHRNVVGLEVGASVGVNIAVRAGCICWVVHMQNYGVLAFVALPNVLFLL